MKCSGSPTTCIVPDAAIAREQTPRDIVQAVLFRELLKPLAKALGPVGDLVLDRVADATIMRSVRR